MLISGDQLAIKIGLGGFHQEGAKLVAKEIAETRYQIGQPDQTLREGRNL